MAMSGTLPRRVGSSSLEDMAKLTPVEFGTAFLAAALRDGGAATHGAMALKFFNKD